MPNVFASEKSMLRSQGPLRMLRPEFPYVKLGWTTKSEILNQRSMVGLEEIPEPMRLGRSAPPALVMPPEVPTVKGRPLRRLRMPPTCHPPRMRLPLKMGSS